METPAQPKSKQRFLRTGETLLIITSILLAVVLVIGGTWAYLYVDANYIHKDDLNRELGKARVKFKKEMKALEADFKLQVEEAVAEARRRR